jgi:hypothetical protein
MDTPSWLDRLAAEVPAGAQAVALLEAACVEPIVNHSIRVLRYALELRRRESVDALLHSCLLHDVGASWLTTGTERFEVQGAELAAALLAGNGWPRRRWQPVWTAIAVHTSPHIAERIGPVARLVRLAVRADFGEALIDEGLRRTTEAELPRLDIERVLSGIVVDQAVEDGRRAPGGSWPGDLLTAHRTGVGPDARLAAF